MTYEIENNYEELKRDLLDSFLAGLTPQELDSVKFRFQNVINSMRVMNHINDVECLIRVLEARNEIRWLKIDCLKTIAEIVDRPRAVQRIEQFQSIGFQKTKEFKISLSPVHIERVQVKQETVAAVADSSSAEINGAFEMVSDEIGNDWRKLARLLNIKEGKINEIEMSCRNDPSNEQKTLQVLHLYQRNKPKAHHISEIIEALKEIPRRPLAMKLKETYLH